MRVGEKVRIKEEKNKFEVYRVGHHTVQLLYKRPNFDVMRIIEIPRFMLEPIKEEIQMTAEQKKAVLREAGRRARAGLKGYSREQIWEELFGDE